MFSYKSIIVSILKFKSLIHFEFIFVYSVRKCSSFILLHIVGQFSQHDLLKQDGTCNNKKCYQIMKNTQGFQNIFTFYTVSFLANQELKKKKKKKNCLKFCPLKYTSKGLAKKFVWVSCTI